MKKRVLSVLLVMSLVVSLFGTVATAATVPGPTLKGDVVSSANQSGATVQYNVELAANPGLAVARFDVVWNESAFALTGVQFNDGVMPDYATNTSGFGEGRHTFYLGDLVAKQNFVGTGVLVTLTFKVLNGAEDGEYPVRVTACSDASRYDFMSYNLETHSPSFVAGSITLAGAEILPENPDPIPPVEPEPPVDDPAHENCPSAKFTDVNQDLWYHHGIDYVIDNGLMNGVGDTLFAPNGTTNRAMIVTILHRLEGTPGGETASFQDVADGQWYSEAVGWAAANGIVTGYSADTFGPMNPITREQMAAILYRYAQYKGCNVSEAAGLEAFGDAGTVSSYAVPALEWAVGAELINGMDGNLNPKGTATRAQVATILMRFCENVAN